tara:strand:+ start:1502 stop:1810 length:309 start_codon:yes stop_codon:yes gene_type:complete
MAYKQNWNPDEKPSEKEMISYLTTVVPDLVDTAFLVIAQNDDGGRHIVMMAEWDEQEQSPWKEGSQNIDNKGWRVMRMTVPTGYLGAFYNADGTKRKTKERD